MKESTNYRIRCNKCNKLFSDSKLGDSIDNNGEHYLILAEDIILEDNNIKIDIDKKLNRNGWTHPEYNTHLCEECSEPNFSMTIKNLNTNKEITVTGTTKWTTSIKLWNEFNVKKSSE